MISLNFPLRFGIDIIDNIFIDLSNVTFHHEEYGSFGYYLNWAIAVSFLATLIPAFGTLFFLPGLFKIVLALGSLLGVVTLMASPWTLFDWVFNGPYRLGFFYLIAVFVKFTRKDSTWWADLFKN